MAYIHVQTRDGPKPVHIPIKLVLGLVVLVLLLAVAGSCYYSIDTGERGVIQRFGRYVRQVGPGLHFKWPFGIEKVTPVNVEFRYKEELGFRTLEPGVETRFETSPRAQRGFEEVSLMLTGDLNCALVEWSVQYNIKDPRAYLFNVRTPRRTIRDLSESIMREVVGDRSVNEVIIGGREEINYEVKRQLQEVLDLYRAGIHVTQVICQTIMPPREVKDSFNEVNMAQQERDRLVNEALKGYNKVIPKAKGEAQKVVNEAEGYAQERINRAQGDTARFKSLLAEYKKAPEITRRRIYLETLSEILPRIRRKVILDEDARSVLPLLDLGDRKERRMP